jgi:hypothetical protein
LIREFYDRARALLGDRRFAYRKTFAGQRGTAPDIVLRDLAKFCRAHESTMHIDARAHAVAEGRREVWLRIQRHMNLSPEQLWDLYDGRTPTEE